MSGTDQKAAVVPGIDLAALDAVQDKNVKAVLQSIVDGLNVRNGNVGIGDQRFVTAGELGLAKGRTAIGGNYSGGALQPARNTTGITPSEIGRIISELQAMIIESPLFKDLGERISLIDKPNGIFTRLGFIETVISNEITERTTADTAEITAREALGARVGTAETGLLTQTNLRVNSDNAIATAINTIWAAVGNNLGLVQGGTSITVNPAAVDAVNWNQVQATLRGPNNEDGSPGPLIASAAVKQTSETALSYANGINAKYTIKVDINGYVSGFGLMGTSTIDGRPQFDFLVRADRFAIASPEGPGITPAVPFIVLTTPTIVDGRTVPPGVYLDKAFVNELIGVYIEAGYLKAANIYSGSRLVDYDSGETISTVAVGNWQGTVTAPGANVYTNAYLLFRGPDTHAATDVYHRLRRTGDAHQVSATIIVSATADHYLSIWKRSNGGAWEHLAKIVEPQADYGSATVARTVLLDVEANSVIEFGVSTTDESLVLMDAGKSDMRDMSISVTCTNM